MSRSLFHGTEKPRERRWSLPFGAAVENGRAGRSPPFVNCPDLRTVYPLSWEHERNEAPTGRKERQMKGYSTAAGYMGYVSWLGKYILFSTDQEYRDFLED